MQEKKSIAAAAISHLIFSFIKKYFFATSFLMAYMQGTSIW